MANKFLPDKCAWPMNASAMTAPSRNPAPASATEWAPICTRETATSNARANPAITANVLARLPQCMYKPKSATGNTAAARLA